MKTEYRNKVLSFVKWLIPFFAAVFLLFGCGQAPAGASGGSQPASSAVETTAAVMEMPAAVESSAAAGAEAAGTQIREDELQSSDERLPDRQSSETREAEQEKADAEAVESESSDAISEDGHYTSKEDVALYIHTYGWLPDNFMTKKEAEAAGWVSKEGNLWDVAPGMSIGGSRFGNYEGALPDKKGRTWYECDIDFDGSYRGAERIVFSNDGLIYYTGDHYKTFEQLY